MSYLSYLDDPRRFVYKLYYDQQPRVPSFNKVADKAPSLEVAYEFWSSFVDNAPLATRRFNHAPLKGVALVSSSSSSSSAPASVPIHKTPTTDKQVT